MGVAYDKRIRAEALQVYGGRCFCCGEDRPPFLCLDHINNDGAEHRRQLKATGKMTGNFTRALKALGWPNDPPLQVACWNCNMTKLTRGGCPHTGFRVDASKEHRRTRHRHKLRTDAMAAYGGKCACCGEDEIEFLVLDHVNHDGGLHREQLKETLSGKAQGGVTLYQHLKNLGWPDEGLQTLCANCNGAKRSDSNCPHQEV